MKTTSEIEIYETNGEESPIANYPLMTVESHWNRNEMIVLKIGKKSVTVLADELKKAIDNATNIRRF